MRVNNSATAASAAKGRSTAVAMTALLKKGSSSKLRPQGPIMASVSSGPNPNPPWVAGTLSASTPSSASPAQVALSQPAARP